jgi:hypothetical protein
VHRGAEGNADAEDGAAVDGVLEQIVELPSGSRHVQGVHHQAPARADRGAVEQEERGAAQLGEGSRNGIVAAGGLPPGALPASLQGHGPAL